MREPSSAVVRLAGALAIEHEGRRATERDLPGRQPRLTFAALAWEHDRPVSHEELAAILWPGELPSTWQPALRNVVSKVRAMFELAGFDGAAVVSGGAGVYRLALPPKATVDVEVAMARVAEAAGILASGGVDTARRLAGEARGVLSRPLLAGIDSPWLDRRRDELGAALVRSLELLGECRRLSGEYDHAIQAFDEVIRREPFREPAWRALMRVHAEAGNVAEALRTFERCRALLADELGVDPSPETQELHVSLLRGSPREGTALKTMERVATPPAMLTVPPYRGLRHFDESDAPMFFGRDMEVGVLLERLGAYRFVAVVGPSGSGKSSLVRAGLVPALRGGALPDADTWRHLAMVPGSRPCDALATALVAARPDGSVRAGASRLGEDDDALHDAACAVLAGRPAGEQILLLVDQLEELFTLCRDDTARRRFVTALLRATRRPDARLVVVVTLRADFYGRAAEHPDLAEAISSSQVLVPPLDGDGLQLAIEGPARLVGLRFEDGLVGRILADVAGEPGALPLLQHALLALYERRADHVLTRGSYDDIGGVSGALARQAETLWSRLDEDRRVVLRRILLRLTQPGNGTEDTRRRALVDELVTDPESDAVVEEVIDALTRERLVVTSADPATGARSVEIAHEALLRGWPRLASWIDDDRAGLLIHRRLTDAAGEWDRHARHADFLYSGARLAEARRWLHEHDPALNPLERVFVAASEEAEERAAGRRARMRRLTTLSLTAGLVVVAALALVASAQRARADREGDLARSREIAAEASTQLAVDPELSLLLAIEAYEVAPTSQAQAALRQALVRNPLLHRLRTEGPDPHVAVSPDGSLVATIGFGAITVWDAEAGSRVVDLTDEEGRAPGGVVQGAFSPDGTRFAGSDLDGKAWIWRLPGGELERSFTWQRTGRLVYLVTEEGVTWSADGSRIAVAGHDGRARILDAASGRTVAVLRGPGSRRGVLARIRLTPDGTRVAVEGANGAVRIFDPATSTPLATTAPHGSPLWGMKFSGDGTRLLTAGGDGTAVIWDAATGRALRRLHHDVSVRDAVFSPDGTRVLTGDSNGVARVWDSATGETVAELVGHDARVNQVRFGPAGRLALTASVDGTARIWDAGAAEPLAVLIGSTQVVADAEFSADGRFVVTAGDDARIWRIPQGAVNVVKAHDAPVYDLALSADGERMITGGTFDGKAKLWELDGRRLIAELPHEPGTIMYVDITRDGTRALTAASYMSPGLARDPEPVRVWDAATGKALLELPLPADDPLDVCGGRCAATEAAFDPQGRRVAAGGFDGRVAVFDVARGERLVRTESLPGQVNNVDWSEDGRILLVGSEGTLARPVVFDAATGRLVRRMPAHEMGLQYGQVALGDAGRLAATSGGAITRIFRVEDGQVVAELRHRGAVHDVSFSRDARLVVTASSSGAVIWDLASQRALVTLPGRQGAMSVSFANDDAMIAVGGVDGTVRFYACEVCQPVEELLALARERVTRQLTAQERARFLHEATRS